MLKPYEPITNRNHSTSWLQSVDYDYYQFSNKLSKCVLYSLHCHMP